MAGKVESFLKSELEKKNALLFVLIDSEVSNLEASSKLAQDVEKIGASAILVGGSSATDQIEIILNQKDLLESSFSISKGAYYRQVGQSREKLVALFYSIILLRGLGILLPDDIDVISKLSEQISVINESDIFPEREDEVISVIEKLIRQASNM